MVAVVAAVLVVGAAAAVARPDDGPTGRPVLAAGGVRYELGEPGDEAVVGDWDCDGLRTPALYRPTTGQVFEFASWGDGLRSLPARSSPVVGGRAEVIVDRSGCERVVVGRTTPFGPSGRKHTAGGE